jgi:hypothetical protein
MLCFVCAHASRHGVRVVVYLNVEFLAVHHPQRLAWRLCFGCHVLLVPLAWIGRGGDGVIWTASVCLPVLSGFSHAALLLSVACVLDCFDLPLVLLAQSRTRVPFPQGCLVATKPIGLSGRQR